jgi:2,3-bisphosphoglycerate-independent phosphoglycerate mutase
LKYLVLIIDGASGWPTPALGGRTSLEAAHIPNLDRLAREGTVGLSHTVPPGMEASSAVACMSVMGFDPTLYYAGRGPIEAMAMGVDLEPGQVAMRCNLVTVQDGLMRSYASGHIPSEEAHELVEALQAQLGDQRLGFHRGVGFRHILTVRDGADLLETEFTPPHDITGCPVASELPRGKGAALARSLMDASKTILADHPVNRARVARGELPATQIWLFWPGLRPGGMPSFSELYGLPAAMSSAVDLLRGLAKQTGVDFLEVPGVTDGSDNDYAAQMAGCLEALSSHDVVFAHVEAPDEASHAGDAAAKVRAIEDVDALMVPQVIAREGLCLLAMPDHPTPLPVMTHVAEPVPFLLWGPGFGPNGASAYSEADASRTGLEVAPGHLLMRRLLGRSC